MTYIEGIPDETIILAVVAIAAVFLFAFFKKKKDEGPPKIDIDIEGPKELADMIKTANANVFSDKILLWNGPIKLGRITKMMPWHFDSEASLKANLNANKEAEKLRKQIIGNVDLAVENFYLFEVIKDGLIGNLGFIFGFGKKYHIVDQKAAIIGYKQISINLYMQPYHYFKNVYIYSGMSKAVALNIAYRITVKQVLNGVINFLPKMDYIETKTANYAAKAREYSDIKDKTWKKREEHLEKESDEEPNI